MAINRLIRSPLAWWLAGLMWVLYFALALAMYTGNRYGAYDFLTYYRASVYVSQGQPMYTGLLSETPYLYPPFLAQLFAPVVALITDFRGASLVWFVLNSLFLLTGTALLVRQMPTRPLRWWIAVAPVLFLAVFHAQWTGQATLLIFLLVAGAWVAFRDDYPVLTGILLALAAWIKVYPAFVILYFLWKRQWRVLYGVIAASLVILLFQIAISGWQTLLTYFTEILPELMTQGQPQLSYANQSILGFAQKLFIPNPLTIALIDSPLLVTITRFSLIGIMLAVLLFLTGRSGLAITDSKARFDLEYALTLITTLMVSSSMSLYGYAWLLIVYAVLLIHLPVDAMERRRVWLAGISSYLLIGVNQLIMLTLFASQALPAWFLSTPFLGGMLLWGVVVWRLWQVVNTPQSAPSPSVTVS